MIESIMCIGVSPPPQKYVPSFLPGPLLKLQAVQGPPLISPYILVFRELPNKNRIFQWTRIIFILNPIQSFKINKFLIKISQFIRLVMRKKNLFVNFYSYYIFQILVYFYVKTATPWKRSPPLFPAKPVQKLRSC